MLQCLDTDVITAKQFQIVLDIVHAWYLKGFRDLLVHGQLALPYDFGRDLKYCVKYCVKPENIYCRALREEQRRGTVHEHILALPSIHHHVTITGCEVLREILRQA